ncbi:9149_t:CDS:2 [Ambispora leptoticha]|uniref:9149_t:CDS:1 n=1 Tax=Ambispora leptoticha TaxID=144679 RepID=A0A9N9DDX1_9GLOM|nr:9149_t:CDS:2 [Ambispora leptoticha]
MSNNETGTILERKAANIDDSYFVSVIATLKELTRDDAVSELQILAIGLPRVTLKSPIGEVELRTTYIGTILSPLFTDPDRGIFPRWSDRQTAESKARKPVGRAKQSDAIINEIDPLSWSSN